jgi:hypothetical protein
MNLSLEELQNRMQVAAAPPQASLDWVNQQGSQDPSALVGKDAPLEWRVFIAEHSSNSELLEVLASDSDAQVVAGVVKNSCTPPESLLDLSQDQRVPASLRFAILSNPNWPDESTEEGLAVMLRWHKKRGKQNTWG